MAVAVDEAIARHRAGQFVPPHVVHERVRHMYKWEDVAERTEKVRTSVARLQYKDPSYSRTSSPNRHLASFIPRSPTFSKGRNIHLAILLASPLLSLLLLYKNADLCIYSFFLPPKLIV